MYHSQLSPGRVPSEGLVPKVSVYKRCLAYEVWIYKRRAGANSSCPCYRGVVKREVTVFRDLRDFYLLYEVSIATVLLLFKVVEGFIFYRLSPMGAGCCVC